MSRPKIYLAGPISGLSYEEATRWRLQATEALAIHGVECYSPMRFKEYLHGVQAIPDAPEGFNMSTSEAITARDRNDVLRCDAMLVNFLGARRPSLGTAVEFGWADAWRKPVVLVMEGAENPHDHAMLRSIAGFRARNIEEGIEIIRKIVLPDRIIL